MWLAYVLRWKAWGVERVADREGGEVVSGNFQRSWNRIHKKEIRPCCFFFLVRCAAIFYSFFFIIKLIVSFFFVFCSFRVYKRRKMRDFQKNKNCYNHKNRIIIFWLEYKKIFFSGAKIMKILKNFVDIWIIVSWASVYRFFILSGCCYLSFWLYKGLVYRYLYIYIYMWLYIHH